MKPIMHKFFVIAFSIPVLFFALGFQYVEAGFGITPPYVRNTSLIKNSTYEQQVLMVRGEANEDQIAQIIVDAPEIQDWIEILEGPEIPLPKGQQKVPMTVRVKVPDDAEFKTYEGSIRIRTIPTGGVTAGAVSISLGAMVDIDLTVIDKVIKDFRVMKISVAELSEGHKFGWLFFPGKVNFDVALENIGNIDVAPSKVDLRIYDGTGKVLLEETKNLGRIPKVKPYATDTVTAEIPTRLPAGSYIARYRVYNDEEIKQEGDLSLSIKPYGQVQAAGFGFLGLSIAHKISVLLPIFTVLIIILYGIKARNSRRQSRS
jgi:hypothetical protein